MAEAKNSTEKQRQPEKKPAPIDETTKTVLGKFDEKEAEQVKRVEELFEKRISGSKMAEIALNEVRSMKEQQKQVVHTTFERFKKQFQEKSEENKSERDILAKQLLEQAETEVDARIKNIEMILNILVKGDYITEEEAAALKRVLVGIEKISAKDIQTQEILLKLQEHKELNSQDYDRIVSMIDAHTDFTNKDAKPREKFEVTTAGILVGFMTGAQRYRLIQEIMDSPKREQTAEVIDGFLRCGILTVAQGEELFRQAVQKKIIREEEFRDVYRKRLDQGFYVDEVKKVKDALDAEIKRMKGMYSDNLMNRVVGTPLLGAGMLLHSFFWILTNVLASGGDFKNMFKNNPYIWAAIGEGALGLEITSGSIKKGTGTFGIGSGWLSRVCERISEKEGPINTVKQNAYAVIGDIYLNYPDFGSYLEHGGVATILEIRKAKAAQGLKGKELAISFEELLKTETNPEQQARLRDAQRKLPQKTSAQINGMAEALTVLEIKTQDEFNGKLSFIKAEQGLTSGPVTGSPPSQPQIVQS